MTRRITIARDGMVKLNGKATRWVVTFVGQWMVHHVMQPLRLFESKPEARVYLATLTDEELRG